MSAYPCLELPRRLGVRAYKRRVGVACSACAGKRHASCEACRGEGLLVWLPSVERWVQREGGHTHEGRRFCHLNGARRRRVVETRALCPVCRGSGLAMCSRCMGDGHLWGRAS